MSRLDEKRFEALGQTWTARFDFNATCAIEEETGESFYSIAAPFFQIVEGEADNKSESVMAVLGRRYNSRIRLILFYALLGAHGDEITLVKTGEIISDMGLGSATKVVLWAIARGLGTDAAADADDAEGNAAAASPAPGNRKQPKAAAKAG